MPTVLAELNLSPSRDGIGRKVEVVTIAKTDSLKFENDLKMKVSNYAGVIEVINERGEVKRVVQVDRGDRVVIRREGSFMADVVRGGDWGRRR